MRSSPCFHVLVCACFFLLAGAVGTSCNKAKPPELSPGERCRQGCERRLACVEELALDKAVTEANREHVKRSQARSRKGHLAYCLKACNEGQARFQAFARCGLAAKDCEGYFRCESAAVKALERDALTKTGGGTQDPPRRRAP